MESLGEAVDHVRPWHYEGRFVKPDGESIWFSASSSPVIEGGDIVFYGVLMDITDRKKWQQTLAANERRYRDLFNEAPVMYVITENRRGEPYVQDVNNMFAEVLGYSRREVINTPLKKYYAEESAQELMNRGGYQRALDGTFSTEERTFVAHNGKAVHTLLHALPEIDDEGRTVGTRAMFVDITARKHAEEQTKRLQMALAQSQKMEAIGTLACGIAHDFNNILSAVIGYTELALNDTQEQTLQHQNLEHVLVAGMRARDLVRQILTFSRQNERELRPLQIEPLIKEALTLLRSSLPSTIEISQKIDSDLDNVMADPIQIHQIIMNICTNATQAMEDNGGQLIVRLSEITLTLQDIHLYPGLKPGT
jgi:PAS domain S-box-containing protein